MDRQRIIRVGVTGHRFLHDLPLLERAIHAVLEKISSRHPNEKLVLYNPLAPGADQMAGAAAVEWGIPLIVLLPFAQGEYLAEFPKKERRLFLTLQEQAEEVMTLPSKEPGESAYHALGEYLVERMDYLIAVWNGRAARGPGGTGEVVENFRQTGKPLAWIRADNMLPDTPTLLPQDFKQGSVSYENW